MGKVSNLNKNKGKNKGGEDVGNHPPERDDLTFAVIRELRNNLGAALSVSKLGMSAHSWILYYIPKMDKMLKEFDKRLSEHKDFKAYLEGVKNKETAASLDEKFPEYVAYATGLGEEICPLSIRRFRSEWILKGEPSTPLSLMINKHDLADDPQKMLDLAYEQEGGD